MLLFFYLPLHRQSVFRMAADSLMRNWQRRSKKWRRSTEDPLKRESLGEMDTASKENDSSQDCIEPSIIVLGQENTEDENANVKPDAIDATKSYTPPCSPLRKNAVATRPRPVSLGFLPNLQLKEHENKMKDKVLSDPSLANEKCRHESIEHSPDVWIPRYHSFLVRRRPSDGARQSICSRNSSVISGDTSPLSGSKKSLSHISQESLADSGVSETPGSSPSNTLNSRTRKISAEKREKLSFSLTNVSGTSEPKKKAFSLKSEKLGWLGIRRNGKYTRCGVCWKRRLCWRCQRLKTSGSLRTWWNSSFPPRKSE